MAADRVGGVARQLAVEGKGEPLLDHRRAQARRRRDQSRIVPRKRDGADAVALQLERGLREAPRIADQLTHAVSAGERADVSDGLERAWDALAEPWPVIPRSASDRLSVSNAARGVVKGVGDV